jgi:hypothetical protein
MKVASREFTVERSDERSRQAIEKKLVRVLSYLRYARRPGQRWGFRKIASTLTMLAGTLGSTALTWAQGCPLCYNAAAATKAGGLAALRNGVLILMIPPVLIVGLVCIMGIRRYRNDSAAEFDPDTVGSDDFGYDLPKADGYSDGAPLLSGLPGATR